MAAVTACPDQGSVKPEDRGPFTSSVRDSAGIRIVENARPRSSDGPPWRLAAEPALEIGAASGPEGSQLHGVLNAIRLEDGSIAVADGGSNRIRLYGEAGQHVRDVGGPGGAPGEFGMLDEIGRSAGTAIGSWDAERKRLTHFAYDGRVLREVSADRRHALGVVSRVVGWSDDGTLVLTPGFRARDLLAAEPGERRGSERYLRVQPDGGIDTIAVLRGREEFVTRRGRSSFAKPIPFGRGSHGAVGPDAFFAGESDRFEVRRWSLDGKLERVIRAAVDSRPVTAEDLARYDEERRAAEQRRNRLVRMLGARSSAATEEVALPHRRTRPFFDRIVVDRPGYLWVREFAFESETQQWQVFDPEGVWLGPFTTPARFRVTEIGEDYILGVVVDSMGVEHVRLYRLAR